MTRDLKTNLIALAGALMLAAWTCGFAAGQQADDDPFAPMPATPRPTPTAPAANQPQADPDDPFAPMPTPPRTAPMPPATPAPPMPKPPVEDDPFAPMPQPPQAQPATPPVVPPAQPPVRPAPQPAVPAPAQRGADGAAYGFAAGTSVIIAAPGSRLPWGNTKGVWVPFQYNKQWHLYRSWCQ
jgi:hypothetical protein